MKELFNSILKEQLSSVEFVQDYLQLHFDGNTLICYTWPRVLVDAKDYGIDDEGYRDAICRIITHKLLRVSYIEKQNLSMCFDDKSEINLSLLRNELNIDIIEFAYFRGVNKEWFVLD